MIKLKKCKFKDIDFNQLFMHDFICYFKTVYLDDVGFVCDTYDLIYCRSFVNDTDVYLILKDGEPIYYD